MRSIELQVAKTNIKYDVDRLIQSFDSMRNAIEPHRLNDGWEGWALTSRDGSIESGLWGYHITDEMRANHSTYHPDLYFDQITPAYKYFDWILSEWDCYRARIINTGKLAEKQTPHRDGKVLRYTIPIIPSDKPFIKMGEDYITAHEAGTLYILNGDYPHEPLINDDMDRYHLMFSIFDENSNHRIR